MSAVEVRPLLGLLASDFPADLEQENAHGRLHFRRAMAFESFICDEACLTDLLDLSLVYH